MNQKQKFSSVSYDLYSEEYWTSLYPALVKTAFSILNNLDNNNNFNINDHFEIDKWASFLLL